MTSMMEQIEIDRKQAEFDHKFVKFGYVLFEALERIAAAKGVNEDAYVYAEIAAEALNKFRYKVGIGGGATSTVEPIRYRINGVEYSKTPKVYCGQCSYFEIQTHEVVSPGRTEPVFKKKCIHPFNMGTWENADELKNIPSEINKNNDCVWYLKKESKQTYKTVGLNLEPAIEGRVPTQWLLDNIHKISKEDFYNQELSEEDLRKKTDREEKEALEMAKMSKKCPLCGAKMKYVTDAKTLDDRTYVRSCVCENGHKFIERTILSSDSYKMPN